MSYGAAAALQQAVVATLLADARVTATLGAAVHDALPAGTPPALHALVGEEEVEDRSDGSGAGALHRLTIRVVSSAAGFLQAKEEAAAIEAALDGAPLALGAGRLVDLRFRGAKARRDGNSGTRVIDLTFEARIEGP